MPILDQFLNQINSDPRPLLASVYSELGEILTNQLSAGSQKPLPAAVIRQSEELLCHEFASEKSTTDYDSCAVFLRIIFKKKIYQPNSVVPFARDFIKLFAAQMGEEITAQLAQGRFQSRSEQKALWAKKDQVQELINDVASALDDYDGDELDERLCELVCRIPKNFNGKISFGPRTLFVNFLRQTFRLTQNTETVLAVEQQHDSIAATPIVEWDQDAHDSVSTTNSLSKTKLNSVSNSKFAHPVSSRPFVYEIEMGQPSERRLAETYEELKKLTSRLNWRGLSANDRMKAKALALIKLLETIHDNGLGIEPKYLRSLNERDGLFLDDVTEEQPTPMLERPNFYDGEI